VTIHSNPPISMLRSLEDIFVTSPAKIGHGGWQWARAMVAARLYQLRTKRNVKVNH
jgi:hypothetical protein